MTKMEIISRIFYLPFLVSVFGGIYGTAGLVMGNLGMIPQQAADTGLIIGFMLILMGNLWVIGDRISAAHRLLLDAMEQSNISMRIANSNTVITQKLVENQGKLFEILELKSMSEESKARGVEK